MTLTSPFYLDTPAILDPAPDVRGLRLSVYRDAEFTADHTNGGISARFDTLTLVGVLDADNRNVFSVPPSWRVFPPRHNAPAVIALVRTYTVTSPHTVVWLEPAEIEAGRIARPHRHHMFGGNYAGTSDSRFAEILAQRLGYPINGPIRVHDRTE